MHRRPKGGYFERRRRLVETLGGWWACSPALGPGFRGDLLLRDSTPVKCASARARRSSAPPLPMLRSAAGARSDSRWFWGFGLHAIRQVQQIAPDANFTGAVASVLAGGPRTAGPPTDSRDWQRGSRPGNTSRLAEPGPPCRNQSAPQRPRTTRNQPASVTLAPDADETREDPDHQRWLLDAREGAAASSTEHLISRCRGTRRRWDL